MTVDKKRRVAFAAAFLTGVLAAVRAIGDATVFWPLPALWKQLRGPQRFQLVGWMHHRDCDAGVVLRVPDSRGVICRGSVSRLRRWLIFWWFDGQKFFRETLRIAFQQRRNSVWV